MPEDAITARAAFPFLLGCRRSGTTLLRVMFDANPQIAVPLETYFPVDPVPAWIGADGSLDVAHAAEDLQRQTWCKKMALDPQAVRDELVSTGAATYPDLLRAFFRVYADAQGKPRYANKTPRHVIFIPQLARMFPEGRFVHIVRDGRNVALSILERDRSVPDLAAAARLWREHVERGRADGRALGPERYAEVRYEDLLDGPEDALRRLCAFVDVPFDDAMLRYYERIPEMVIGSGQHRKLSQPPTKGLRDWRTVMSRTDVAVFESIAGRSLDAFGYERSDVHASVGVRVRVGWQDGTSFARSRLAGVRRRAGLAAKGARGA